MNGCASARGGFLNRSTGGIGRGRTGQSARRQWPDGIPRIDVTDTPYRGNRPRVQAAPADDPTQHQFWRKRHRQKSVERTDGADVIAFPRWRFAWIFGPRGPYRRSIQERVAAVRRFTAELEHQARHGSFASADWIREMELPILDRAIKECCEIRALGRQYGLTGR
jgi:hypothetical protein